MAEGLPKILLQNDNGTAVDASTSTVGPSAGMYYQQEKVYQDHQMKDELANKASPPKEDSSVAGQTTKSTARRTVCQISSVGGLEPTRQENHAARRSRFHGTYTRVNHYAHVVRFNPLEERGVAGESCTSFLHFPMEALSRGILSKEVSNAIPARKPPTGMLIGLLKQRIDLEVVLPKYEQGANKLLQGHLQFQLLDRWTSFSAGSANPYRGRTSGDSDLSVNCVDAGQRVAS